MRAAIVAALAAGCTPTITTGAYLCGAQEMCPPHQVCNPADGTCGDPILVEPFACDPMVLHEPDDTAAQGLPIQGLACVSNVFTAPGCLAAGDTANWLRFTTPANCTSVAVHAHLTFPIAFEPLALQLWNTDSNAQLAPDPACNANDAGAGNAIACINLPLHPGTSYAVQIAPAGGGDCGGNCAFNHYNFTLALASQ